MAADPLTLLIGLALLFFAPGFLLLHALFPMRRYFGPFHALALPVLSVVVSVAIVVVVGMVLGFLPRAGEVGWFQGSQTGAPVLEIVLGSIALVLFAVAWWRGAFPLLGRRAEVAPVQERGEPEEITLLRDLRLEEERLRQETARVRRRARQSRDPGVQNALSEAANELERERRQIAGRAREIEKRAGERRYGRGAERPGFPLGRGRGP